MTTSVFDGHPVAINELGTKWWIADDLNDWCRVRPERNLLSKGYQCWAVETVEGHRSFLVTKGMNIVKDSQSSEAIAVWLDCQRMLEFEEN